MCLENAFHELLKMSQYNHFYEHVILYFIDYRIKHKIL